MLLKTLENMTVSAPTGLQERQQPVQQVDDGIIDGIHTRSGGQAFGTNNTFK